MTYISLIFELSENSKVVGLVLLDLPSSMDCLWIDCVTIRGCGGQNYCTWDGEWSSYQRVYWKPFWVWSQFHGASCWSFGWLCSLLCVHVCLLHKDSKLPEQIGESCRRNPCNSRFYKSKWFLQSRLKNTDSCIRLQFIFVGNLSMSSSSSSLLFFFLRSIYSLL